MSILVQRVAWTVREGHSVEEALEASQRMAPPAFQVSRTYQSGVGSPESDRIIFEFEHDDLAAMQAFWEAVFSDPGIGAFMKEWLACCYPAHTTELWRRAE